MQDHMLAPDGVEQDVIDIGEGRDEEPWPTGGRVVEPYGIEVKDGGSGLGQPDRMTLLRRQPWINESRQVPTARRRDAGPAGG